MENYVTLKDFTEELFCMLTVCFEGNVSYTQEGAELLLPDGSRFIITVSKGMRYDKRTERRKDKKGALGTCKVQYP